MTETPKEIKDTDRQPHGVTVKSLVNFNIPEFEAGINRACLILAECSNAAKVAISKLGVAFSGMANDEYLKHHRRLPGSTRTRRLRKKRITVVANWFCSYSF